MTVRAEVSWWQEPRHQLGLPGGSVEERDGNSIVNLKKSLRPWLKQESGSSPVIVSADLTVHCSLSLA